MAVGPLWHERERNPNYRYLNEYPRSGHRELVRATCSRACPTEYLRWSRATVPTLLGPSPLRLTAQDQYPKSSLFRANSAGPNLIGEKALPLDWPASDRDAPCPVHASI